MNGLFLDFDGTLADTLSAMRSAYAEFMDAHDVQASEQEFTALNGPRLPEIVAHLRKAHGLEQPEDVLHEQYSLIIDESAGDAKAAVGTHQLLSEARARGFQISIVSSNYRSRIEKWVNRQGIGSLIDVIVGGDDVINGKPAPDPYLKALELTACTGDQSFAVEDSEAGVRSACAAGISVIYLQHTTKEDVPDGACAIARDLSEIIEIIARVSKH